MKAKLYIGLVSAMLLPGFLIQAQISNDWSYRNDNAGYAVNNYYNHDYYYSSRISRFHRSYATFSYYSPVYTDTYWYNYQPYAWGVSIYGGSTFGYGVTYNYPVYYGYGWDYPSFGGSYYWGYEPFYYNWYSPVVVNISIGRYRPYNHYSWNGRNRWYNDYRPTYNVYNNYYYGNSSGNYGYSNSARRSASVSTTNTSNDASRRSTGTVSNDQSVNRGNPNDKSNNGLHLGEARRTTNPSNTGGSSTNVGNRGNNSNVNPGNLNNANRRTVGNMNQGNNNNLNPGNTGNVNRGNNSANSGMNSNSNQRQVNTNQKNIRTNQVVSQPARSTSPARSNTNTVNRSQTITSPARQSTNTSSSVRTVSTRSAGETSRSATVNSGSSKSTGKASSETRKSTSTSTSGTRRK